MSIPSGKSIGTVERSAEIIRRTVDGVMRTGQRPKTLINLEVATDGIYAAWRGSGGAIYSLKVHPGGRGIEMRHAPNGATSLRTLTGRLDQETIEILMREVRRVAPHWPPRSLLVRSSSLF